jgi:hypothetical protein
VNTSLRFLGILLKEKINIIDCKTDFDTAAKKANRFSEKFENASLPFLGFLLKDRINTVDRKSYYLILEQPRRTAEIVSEIFENRFRDLRKSFPSEILLKDSRIN